jgi:hypothetical protein
VEKEDTDKPINGLRSEEGVVAEDEVDDSDTLETCLCRDLGRGIATGDEVAMSMRKRYTDTDRTLIK